MASGVRNSSKNSRGLFLQMHSISSVDLLWDRKKCRKRKVNVSTDYFAVERLISRRTSHGTVQYLVKWKGYSGFYNSWEDEENLTADLVRNYNKPIVDKGRLTQQVDNLRLSVLSKLKSKSWSNVILDFNHDCFRFLFHGKGKEGREKGYTLLERDDFNRCNLPENWDRVIDCNGDGVKVKYPFKVRLFLAKSPKTYSIVNGKIQEDQRMFIEKLSIDFSRQPVTIQSQT